MQKGRLYTRGSWCELETQLLLAVDLGYIKKKEGEEILESGKEVERMLKALINSLEEKPSNP
ncbi:MAG: four helix bundle protein [Candidatus Aerophobetes bacterium]|nr:four helix bundle protein [Candidatus Aerophobetes bacterium]